MLKRYHIEICQRALGSTFSTRSLDVVIAANLGQDQIRYQIRHPHFHFDSNAFEASYDYVAKQRQIVLDTLNFGEGFENHGEQVGGSTSQRVDIIPAWEAFGRLTHTTQDFYAHSNYAQLWLDSHPKGDVPDPAQIAALDPEILLHPDLQSGNIYFWDFLAFVPGFYSLALRLTPKDSHMHMNFDHPGRGLLFSYAIEAAVKRTFHEYQYFSKNLDTDTLRRFIDC